MSRKRTGINPLLTLLLLLYTPHYSNDFITNIKEMNYQLTEAQSELSKLIHSYRWTLQDPRATPSQKSDAERALAALYQPTYGSASPEEHNNRVLGGYRATLANPNVSEAAKSHARAMLEQAGADVRTQKERSGSAAARGGPNGNKTADGQLARKLGGYKSALKNPNVSPDAKAHARHMLEVHGVNY